jgi:hypothetical protein
MTLQSLRLFAGDVGRMDEQLTEWIDDLDESAADLRPYLYDARSRVRSLCTRAANMLAVAEYQAARGAEGE